VTVLLPIDQQQLTRVLDAERLIERWSEGRSKQTLRAYSNDLRHFSDWLGGFLGPVALGTAQAVTTLLTKPQGEANEIVRAYRSAMVERGLSPSTINRKLSALRSLVALGKELGFVTFDLATRNVRAEAYRDTRGPEPDAMAALIQEALAHPHKAKAARDVAIFLLLGYGRALRRGEVVELNLEHFDTRGSRVSVLRKGKRERKWLSLDPMVTAKLRAWVALRGKEARPALSPTRQGRAGYWPAVACPAMASTRSWKRWARSSGGSYAPMGCGMQRSRLRSMRPMAMSAPPASSRGTPRSRC
jgi:integrase/recombinase XerC